MISKNISRWFISIIGFSLLIAISFVYTYNFPESFSQSEETKNTISQYTVHITKQSSNLYTLSEGSSQIGSFHTTYDIVGIISSLKESKELITSTIVNDYDTSPFIGYIIAPNNKSDTDLLELANPFADKTTINNKITSEIHDSINSTNKLQTENALIKCNFGMDLNKWYCSTNDLLR